MPPIGNNTSNKMNITKTMMGITHDFNLIKPRHFFNGVEGVVEDIGVVVGIVVVVGIGVVVQGFAATITTGDRVDPYEQVQLPLCVELLNAESV